MSQPLREDFKNRNKRKLKHLTKLICRNMNSFEVLVENLTLKERDLSFRRKTLNLYIERIEDLAERIRICRSFDC